VTTNAQTATEPPLLEDLLCFDLYAASRAVTALYRPLLEEHGLTYPQYLVLVVLLRRGPSTIRDIGTTLRLDHGTLTPLLRRLEERGLLTRERDAADGRAKTVALGLAGEELRPFLEEVPCAITEAVGLSADEMLDLQTTLRALTTRITPEE